MELMKTLLIYMTATMTLSVHSTSAPKASPVPTPADTAIVETADVSPEPGNEAAGTLSDNADTTDSSVTAVPPNQLDRTAQFTPAPVPTITPNAKGYHNLAMGAKGKEVKRLQERLIELKYLPEGAADGAFGRQTYNAVRKFQYYNGLKQDGVAGRATQTNMFENPDIVPNPEAGDAPEETPTPTPAPAEQETPAPAVTEALAETETPKVTETPKATEAPKAKEAPKATEAPKETETSGTPAAALKGKAETEAPAETAAPADKETPEAAVAPAETEAPARKEPQEIVENVDLDADTYEPVDGAVALNESGGPLEFIRQEDGVPVNARPRLMKSGSKIRVSLDDLCACTDWRVTDGGAGTVVLEAAGYTLAVYSEDSGVSATVDGTDLPMNQDDFDFSSDGHFINAEFLAKALQGEAEWDQDESTLMLRIRDKADGETTD